MIQFEQRDPETFRVLDALGLFSTFSSPWFSAIYLLLFISLVGCIIPRTKHHFDALRARPPKTPARLQRLVGFTSREPTEADAGVAIDRGRVAAAAPGLPHRAVRSDSVSAERGYLRETGNLVFHTALVGMLITVGIGGGFGYTGQRVIVQGEPFMNVLLRLRLVQPGPLLQRVVARAVLAAPRRVRRRATSSTRAPALWHPTDFDGAGQHARARRRLDARHDQGQLAADDRRHRRLPARQRLRAGRSRCAIPTARPSSPEPVPFLPHDANLRSRGVVKVPDGLDRAARACRASSTPTRSPLDDGTYASFSPTEHGESLLTLFVYAGDLGLDEGVGVNAYALDIDG